MDSVTFQPSCFLSVLSAVGLTCAYVVSLYIKRYRPDDDQILKFRFIAVSVVSLLAVPVVYCLSTPSADGHPFFEWLGLRCEGLLPALSLPVLLTAVLFAGPILLKYLDGSLHILLVPGHWAFNLSNLYWWRNLVVAPVSEEFVFRACMVPILLPCFGPPQAVFIVPLFFGLGHLHHIVEKMIEGEPDLIQTIQVHVFQVFYTTLFGMYSTFLFLRTGHFVSIALIHSFCNYMGFPPFNEIFLYKRPTQVFIMLVFGIGLVLWLYLLYPLTVPSYYSNSIYHV